MEFIINKVPFEMTEIPEKLFNQQFLSDVTFIIDGKQMFAHSLELMKRSTVFIKQLEPTLGEKKLIPITGYGYDLFYQFVHFIYTDLCEINEENSDALLNLAKEYKVPGLISVVKKYKNIEFEDNHGLQNMKEITSNFFNFQLLSDITFIVEGKHIYAHSLELMKRSSVFQEQLEQTMGEKKQIPITDYGYETFYQFIQFIYTDKCKVNEYNCFNLLKLAIFYKVISFVNFLQNSFKYDDLKLLNFCVSVNDQIALDGVKSRLAENLKEVLDSNAFKTASQESVEEILKIDPPNGTSELDLTNALIGWMKYYCTQNQIELPEFRQKFDKLLHSVRLPILSTADLLDIEAKYTDLFTESDILNIRALKIYGADYENGTWNCTPRLKFPSLIPTNYLPGLRLTCFSVCSDMILGGFTIGKPYIELPECFGGPILHCGIKGVSVKILIKNSESPKYENSETFLNLNVNNYDTELKSDFYGNVISLGSSVLVRPGFIYSIIYSIIYQTLISSQINNTLVKCRRCSDVITNAPTKSVKIIEAHDSMIAMYFLKPDGNVF